MLTIKLNNVRNLSRSISRIQQNTSLSAKFSSLKESRAARRGRLPKQDIAALNDYRKFKTGLIITTIIIGGISYASYHIQTNPKGKLAELYYGSPIESMINILYKYTFGNIDHIFDPSSDELIPTWGVDPYYAEAGIPPGAPAPPLLVLDLEKTLIGTEYDGVHGWRHVKRPGLDKFIQALGQYYEIVLFSENDLGVVLDVMMAIDPDGRCFKLGSSAAESKGTLMLKRLDYMNRDIRKIILIDDNPEAAQLFTRNTLFVPPFEDVQNKHDTILEELIPLLQAFVHDGVSDFRDTLDNLGTHEAHEAVIEYRMRLQERKQKELMKRNRGLGGLIRGVKDNNDPDGFEKRSSVLSPTQIVGHAPESKGLSSVNPLTGETSGSNDKPRKHAIKFQGKEVVSDLNTTSNVPTKKKTGKIFQWLKEKEQNSEEQAKLKMEKMNELFQQRMLDKQRKDSQNQ